MWRKMSMFCDKITKSICSMTLIKKRGDCVMAGLRVFVSSTCYDFSLLRAQIRSFILSLGFEPIMSDYEDVLYDPREHTHTSCVDEVVNCDILVLVMGSRYGGKASQEALNKIDFEKIRKEEVTVDELKKEGNLSVTQLEVLKAIENDIPVYTFIDQKVWHDHCLYEKNKTNGIIDKIIFPSIEKQETAKFVFEFINFVRLRTRDNNIFTFEKIQDIEDALRKQWSSYFQRLLNEQRFMSEERKKMDVLSNQFEDLKTAILSSIENVDQRDVAKGIVRYRRLFEFLFSLKNFERNYFITSKDNWEDILKKANIVEIIDSRECDDEYFVRVRVKTFLICSDKTFYETRLTKTAIMEMEKEWEEFKKIPEKNKGIIVDTVKEISTISNTRYFNSDFEETILKRKNREMERNFKISYIVAGE